MDTPLPLPQAQELAAAILSAREKVVDCPICGTYTDVSPCAICSDTNRDGSVLCVVCDAKDVSAMERTREFHGKYHVLHGVLSPMSHVGPDDLRISELVSRVAQGGVEELDVADSLSSLTAALTERSFHPHSQNIVLTGVCRACHQ